ncbi:MAG TPA: RNA-binding S4 domain-containing protein [Chitinophagales bacterium]|nr:RNA-binding S4 domain-containing protein [Chitinophagales bacterium]
MTKHTFTLNNDSEFIALDKLLKFMQLVNSGGEAHAIIEDGLVKVNGEVEYQKRKKMRAGDHAEFDGQQIIVEA